MKVISWNVNGIRAVMKKGFLDFLRKEKPNILGLQEAKGRVDDRIFSELGYHIFWNDAEKKGYSGTAVLTKIKPLTVSYGIGEEEHDKEGRVITLEFPKFFLVDVYTPNSQRGLTRLAYRRKWNSDFLSYLKKLERKKPVVFMGDLNVAHKEIDLANPQANHENAGFTDEERLDFANMLEEGFIDTFREFHADEKGHYSWWTYRFQARKRNIGWRIDYVCVSKSLKSKLKDAFILKDVLGSDHAPVGVIIDF